MDEQTAASERRYNNRAAVPEYAQHFDRWTRLSKQARDELDCDLDIAYGDHPMEKIDIFRAEGRSRALLMFIHGGYWRSLDKRDHSFLATEFVKLGVTVAMPNYALCPSVKVEDIVRQMLKATAWLYRNGSRYGAFGNNLFVAGHSAGGHLATMMMAAQWPRYAPDLPDRMISGGLSVSGLYDLGPLVHVPSVNSDIRLDDASALRVSPAWMPPATDAPLTVALGGREIEGFTEQHALIKTRWREVIAEDLLCPDDNHFSILETLGRADSLLFRAACRLMLPAAHPV
ncbi:MAG: alpha/beta hydrolase [Rhodocyclaceae bacterium]|jgi:arylformamidase|nr:alpha/beta hydrolase [Rhodocyclaceae bacterium]MCA3134496.1 alpha/beta hydrolase [Rhodocyclaceae bacterium]MCA3145687.1 alpha/beta hydrolase [Rhodocyclaceae bacterium]